MASFKLSSAFARGDDTPLSQVAPPSVHHEQSRRSLKPIDGAQLQLRLDLVATVLASVEELPTSQPTQYQSVRQPARGGGLAARQQAPFALHIAWDFTRLEPPSQALR